MNKNLNIELDNLIANLQLPSDEQIKIETTRIKQSTSLKGKPKSTKHKEALKVKKINKGNIGKSKSQAKLKACKINARSGGLTGAGAKATKEKYSKAIYCYEYPSMKFICEFPSSKEASRSLKLNGGNISNVLNKKCNHTGGYNFQYKNNFC